MTALTMLVLFVFCQGGRTVHYWKSDWHRKLPNGAGHLCFSSLQLFFFIVYNILERTFDRRTPLILLLLVFANKWKMGQIMYMNQKIFLIDIFSKGGGWVVLLYLFFLSVVGSANVKNPFLSPSTRWQCSFWASADHQSLTGRRTWMIFN